MNRMLVEKNETGEVSDGNEEHIIAEWRRGDSCQKSGKELGRIVFQCFVESELVGDDLGYLAEDIPKQSVKGVAGFSLLLIVKL